MTRQSAAPSLIPAAVDDLWERRDQLDPQDDEARTIVEFAIDLLDGGGARVAAVDPHTGTVMVDERARRAILLCFRVLPLRTGKTGPFHHHDRVPLKTNFPGVRVVPGAIARWGSHLEPGVVLMPSFVNIGAYVGARTMVDTWATVGSCALIGRDVHLAGGAGIGGVLEPAGAVPVVIDDHAFVGSRAMIVEGARIRTGAKLGAGVLLTGRTRVFDAQTGDELARGEAPAWSVCVGATYPRRHPGGEFGAPCLLVVRRLEPGATPDALAVVDIFREHDIAG